MDFPELTYNERTINVQLTQKLSEIQTSGASDFRKSKPPEAWIFEDQSFRKLAIRKSKLLELEFPENQFPEA